MESVLVSSIAYPDIRQMVSCRSVSWSHVCRCRVSVLATRIPILVNCCKCPSSFHQSSRNLSVGLTASTASHVPLWTGLSFRVLNGQYHRWQISFGKYSFKCWTHCDLIWLYLRRGPAFAVLPDMRSSSHCWNIALKLCQFPVSYLRRNSNDVQCKERTMLHIEG